ncbi:MAG: hypothetical protein AAGF14_08930 [Pseudomonadota bacterium]
MRSVRVFCNFPRVIAAAFAVSCIVAITTPAQARCYTFQESHNGTDLFNPGGGAKTAATKKLMYSIELWKQKRRIKRVRIGRVSTRCDPWNLDYVLPHHRCYAKARVCY